MDIDKLDYDYVRNCTDAKELSRLLQLLKSFDFPDLENAFSTKIQQLTPKVEFKEYGNSQIDFECLKGNEALHSGCFLEAREFYTRCIELKGSEPKYAANCALACMKLNDYEAALKYIDDAMEEADKALQYKLYLRREKCFNKLGDKQSAQIAHACAQKLQ